MRAMLVALAALGLSTVAAAPQSVSCVAGTYYWGPLHNRHYCVKCPDSWTSSGCQNCHADPKGATCYKEHSPCTRGMRVVKGIGTAADTCAKCAPFPSLGPVNRIGR